MALHPQAKMVLGLVEQAGHPEYWQLEAAEARAQHERHAGALDRPPVEVHSVVDATIPTPDHDIPVRVYRPDDADALGALLWIHGGGHVVGSVALYDSFCRHLCAQSGCAVVSVEYRLAPEHRFPSAVHDCLAAVQWLFEQADSLGFDARRIAVAGDSAGGNLAAAVCLALRDSAPIGLRFQLLIYPALGARPDTDSHRRFADGHLLSAKTIQWFNRQYLRDDRDREDPLYAPLIAPRLEGLPPALIVVAGHDPLRDEGVAYAERLEAAGVDVELVEYPGMIHAFMSMSGALDDGRAALTLCADRVSRRIGGR